jgi:hypothetical protein
MLPINVTNLLEWLLMMLHHKVGKKKFIRTSILATLLLGNILQHEKFEKSLKNCIYETNRV